VVMAYQNNLRDNLNTTIDVPVTVVGNANSVRTSNSPTNGTYPRRGGNGLLIEAVLAIAVIVLAYLYLKERKKIHDKK